MKIGVEQAVRTNGAGIIPVVTLRNNLEYISGSGSSDDPWIFQHTFENDIEIYNGYYREIIPEESDEENGSEG